MSEGLGIDETSKEGRVFKAIIDVLDDISLTVTDLEDDVAELSDGLDEIDEDLGALEEEFYGDECDDECGCDCGCAVSYTHLDVYKRQEFKRHGSAGSGSVYE